MRKIKLKPVPKPKEEERTVFEAKVAPIFRGGGDIDAICGSCDTILLKSVLEGQIRQVVVRCVNCGNYSEVS
jgi:hypothetical protein